MSPDNWHSSPAVRRLVDASANLSKAVPHIAPYFTTRESDLRGLTLFLGDTNDYVIGLKRFGDDGSLEIIWSSGATALECLTNLDKAVQGGKWREDKRALAAPPVDNK